MECDDQEKKVDHTSHLFSSASPPAANGKKSSGTKKGDANGDSQKTTSNGKKRGRSASPAVDDGIANANIPPPSKKQKDGQKAKSGSLHVPVDEGLHSNEMNPLQIQESSSLRR